MWRGIKQLFQLNPGDIDTSKVGADVGDQAKASDENYVYSLVKPPGNDKGILIEAMAEALNTKDFNKLEQTIRDKLEGLMYPQEDCHIPLKTIVEDRNSKRKGKKKVFVFKSNETRECCWKIDKRGAVGETILHLCCLNNKPVHLHLLKRLVNLFPNLLKDIYLGDEYYGETPVHMIIANEDVETLQFVFSKAVEDKINLNLNDRCCGLFFSPEDQKRTRYDLADTDVVGVSLSTNYKGYMYWGEYPLSFAACLELEEIFKLLLKHGADLCRVDSNGNNVLHMMVIHNKKDMFNLAYRSAKDDKEKSKLFETRNKQGFTPLTLAAKQANKEMFDHILEMKRTIAWAYGDVLCASYPLSDIDTINIEDGSINRLSALSIVLSEETKTHLDMLDGLMYQLLHDKWKAYAKVYFYKRMLIYLLYLIAFIAAIYLQSTPDSTNRCYMLNISASYPTADVDISRSVLEALICIAALGFLLYDVALELYTQGWPSFLWAQENAPTRAMFLLSCCFVLITIPCRFTCSIALENVFLTLAICLCVPHCLFFFRGFKLLGPFIVMIYKMIVGDLLRFILIYTIFLLGFSQAMYVVNRGNPAPEFENPIESLLTMFSVMLGEFADMYAGFDSIQSPSAAKVLFSFYIIFVTILLLNMLIAMMGNTFKKIKESKREWKRQWATIVLVMEQSVSKRRRKRKQQIYSLPLGEDTSAGRAILVRTRVKTKDTRTKSVENVVNKLQLNLIKQNTSVDTLEEIDDITEDEENNTTL